MSSSFFAFFDRPTSPNDRRRTCRYSGVRNRVFLGWWDGPEFQTTTAFLKDLSLGGASILIDAPAPTDNLVWISLYKIPPTEWVEASVIEVEKGPRLGLFSRSLTQLRIEFFENCSYDFFKAGIEKQKQ